MKETPPLPPNNERFVQNYMGVEGLNAWVAPGNQVVILLNSNHPDHAASPAWAQIIAADAEVSFRKEAEKARADNNRLDGQLHDQQITDAFFIQRSRELYDKEASDLCSAATWREWAEPESEENDNAK